MYIHHMMYVHIQILDLGNLEHMYQDLRMAIVVE